MSMYSRNHHNIVIIFQLKIKLNFLKSESLSGKCLGLSNFAPSPPLPGDGPREVLLLSWERSGGASQSTCSWSPPAGGSFINDQNQVYAIEKTSANQTY